MHTGQAISNNHASRTTRIVLLNSADITTQFVLLINAQIDNRISEGKPIAVKY